MLELPLFPAERAPLSKLPCGCIVDIEWHIDMSYKLSVTWCDWHYPVFDLPEGTELVDVDWDHYCHMKDLWNE
jgi:hypothetical protein